MSLECFLSILERLEKCFFRTGRPGGLAGICWVAGTVGSWDVSVVGVPETSLGTDEFLLSVLPETSLGTDVFLLSVLPEVLNSLGSRVLRLSTLALTLLAGVGGIGLASLTSLFNCIVFLLITLALTFLEAFTLRLACLPGAWRPGSGVVVAADGPGLVKVSISGGSVEAPRTLGRMGNLPIFESWEFSLAVVSIGAMGPAVSLSLVKFLDASSFLVRRFGSEFLLPLVKLPDAFNL